jgi:hypothetical protein
MTRKPLLVLASAILVVSCSSSNKSESSLVSSRELLMCNDGFCVRQQFSREDLAMANPPPRIGDVENRALPIWMSARSHRKLL